MKSLYIILFFLSSTAFARGFEMGVYSCSSDAARVATWNIYSSGIEGIPVTEYNLQINGTQDVAIRGLATVEEVAGGTLVGLKGMRGSEKIILTFRNDGRVMIGEILCTKK